MTNLGPIYEGFVLTMNIIIYLLIFMCIGKVWKDRRKKYCLTDFKFYTTHYDGNDYLSVNYTRLEKGKKKFLERIPVGTQIGDFVILNYVCSVKTGYFVFSSGRSACFRYKTKYEMENH